MLHVGVEQLSYFLKEHWIHIYFNVAEKNRF